jgi:hypothetical protein
LGIFALNEKIEASGEKLNISRERMEPAFLNKLRLTNYTDGKTEKKIEEL